MNSTILWLYGLLTRGLPESRAFGFKVWLLRRAGAKIGSNVRLYSSVTILGTGALEIGDDVHVGPHALLCSVAPAKITLGSHIDIGPEVTMLTGSHEINAHPDPADPLRDHMAGKGTAASVSIGNGSWLCARTLILPGVSLPAQTVTAAGAVVTQSITTPNTLLAGHPAVPKKTYSN